MRWHVWLKEKRIWRKNRKKWYKLTLGAFKSYFAKQAKLTVFSFAMHNGETGRPDTVALNKTWSGRVFEGYNQLQLAWCCLQYTLKEQIIWLFCKKLHLFQECRMSWWNIFLPIKSVIEYSFPQRELILNN